MNFISNENYVGVGGVDLKVQLCCPSSMVFQGFAFTRMVLEHAFVGQREVLPFLELSTTINISDAARDDCG